MGNKKQQRKYYWEDKKTGLAWERYNPESADNYKFYNDLVNIWSSDKNIRTYIHFDEPIADSFKMYLATDEYDAEGFFYAFDEDNSLVGVVYITAPTEDFDETNIDYLITNPRMTNRGIASRMISSVKNNPQFFAESHRGTFVASVEHTNEASKRVFIKNGFKMFKPMINEKMIAMGVLNVNCLSSKFGRWYFKEREMEKTND